MDKKLYSVDDFVNKVLFKIKLVDTPPSGKYYQLEDGATFEKWNAGVRVKELLDEGEGDD